MKKLLIILLAVVALVLVAQIDDDLNADATNLLSRIDANAQSNAYLYLMGIYASADEDPITVGKQMLAENNKRDADDAYKVVEYPQSKKLPLPEGNIICRPKEKDCIALYFSSKLDAKKLLSEHKLLVARSNTFIAFNEYTTDVSALANGLFPTYQYVIFAERIKLIAAIALYSQGDKVQAVESLVSQLKGLRNVLALQDTLLGKMVFISITAEVIDVLSVISSKEGKSVAQILPLSQAEKSFYKVAAAEFAFGYHFINTAHTRPVGFEPSVTLPRWMWRIVFKPNMAMNAHTPVLMRYKYLAKLSLAEFANKVETKTKTPLASSILRNPLDSYYTTGRSLQDFDIYPARVMDLDAKIALYNQVHHLKLKPTAMHNPYYGPEVPTESGGKLCFKGPMEDTRFVRCLRVKI